LAGAACHRPDRPVLQPGPGRPRLVNGLRGAADPPGATPRGPVLAPPPGPPRAPGAPPLPLAIPALSNPPLGLRLPVGPPGRARRAAAVWVAVGFSAGQLRLSTWWFRAFQFGPLEWVWRALTYLQLPPVRRPRAPA